MHSTTVILPLTAFAGLSMAQISHDAAACNSSFYGFVMAGPTFPPEIEPYFTDVIGGGSQTGTAAATTSQPNSLEDPESFVEAYCSIAAELPESLLPAFKSYASALISHGSVYITGYDDYVTDCVTTGTAAASITSYVNAILTGTGPLCKATSTPTSAPNGTISTPAPTATGANSTGNPGTSVPTAAAVRPTGVLSAAAALGGLIGVVALL